MAKSRAFSQQTSPPDTVGSAHQGLERKYFTGGKYFKILCHELKMSFLPVKEVCFIFKIFLASKKFNISQGENIAKPVEVTFMTRSRESRVGGEG